MLCTSILIGNTLNEPDKWKNVHPSKHLQSTAFQERVIECCLNGRIYDENCRRQNVSRWITSRKIRVAGPLKDRSTTLGMRTRNKATSNLRFVYCPLYISYVCYFCKLAFWRQVSWIGDQGFFIANTRNFEGRRMLWYTNHWNSWSNKIVYHTIIEVLNIIKWVESSCNILEICIGMYHSDFLECCWKQEGNCIA